MGFQAGPPRPPRLPLPEPHDQAMKKLVSDFNLTFAV
jgi:4-hydroxy-tetrahydrodipicolinate synthase